MAHTDKSPQQTGRDSASGDVRRYRTRGIDVEIREGRLGLAGSRAKDNQVELTLDGTRIDVEMIDGKYHCQLANQFTAFDSLDQVVDTLLANEGRTWTLHGHVCDARCAAGGHHHHGAEGHDHQAHGDHGHSHAAEHDHDPGDHDHAHGARADSPPHPTAPAKRRGRQRGRR